MPASNSLAISKFLGKDRYEHYVQELTGYGTVGGTQLSPAQRKQAFKVRANKVQFEKFVDTLLAKKAAAVKSKPAGKITGMKPFAFSRTQSAKAYSDQMIAKYGDPLADAAKGGALVKTSGGELTEIANGLGGILTLFKEEQKVKKDTAELDRKKKEEEKRKLLKSRLKKGFEKIKKVAEKVLAPVKGLLQRIIDFIMTIFIGRFIYRLLEWWGDPANKGKVDSIIRFFGDHWPKLLTLYIAFGTSFGRFAIGLSKAVFKGAIKLGFAIAKLLAAKKVKGAMGAARFLGGGKGKLLANVLGTGLAVGGTYAAVNAMKGDGGDQKTQGFSGGGLAVPRFAGGGFNLASLFGSLGKMGGAGAAAFSGFVSGEKGVDKVPAMLSDGEFVMSRGAVDMYGVDTLEQMNAAGGGTNKPKVMSGTTYAAGGGFVGKAAAHLKHDEALSSLTKGTNDYIKPGGKSVKTGKAWNTISAKTLLHSYIDSVGQPTIGWGATYYDSILNGKKPVKPGDSITKDQADNILNTNIMNLATEYSKKIPTWSKMNDDQKAGVLLVGYNAPYGPIGAYKNLTAALKSGDMATAAREVQRGGPSASRISIERRLLLSGPRDLSKVRTITTAPTKSESTDTNKNQESGFNWSRLNPMNWFNPNSVPETKSRRFHGGPVNFSGGGSQYGGASQFSPTSRPKPRITPLPKPSPNVSMMQLPNMGGGYGAPSSPGGSTIPSFSASSGGSDRLNKIKTLGIGA